MNTYRAAIVGLGGMGGRRSAPGPYIANGLEGTPHSHPLVYATLPQTQVVAGCDILPAANAKFADAWSDHWPDVHTYTDVDEMLAKEKIDILSITTSSHLHRNPFVAACNAGVRAIYCEKPFATTIADATAMVEAAEKNGTVVSINHWPRWSPGVFLAREAIKKGTIGKVRRVIQTAGGPRAMLFQNGTYAMDWIAEFADADPIEVYADLDPEFDTYGPRYAGDGGRDPKLDPGLGAHIRFANGVRGFYNGSQGTANYWETFIQGETGWIRYCDGLGLDIAVPDTSMGGWQKTTVPIERYGTQGMTAAVVEIIHVLEHGGQTSSPARHAYRSTQMMLGALQSHHHGGVRVKLPTVDE